jgi:hypothetical protein
VRYASQQNANAVRAVTLFLQTYGRCIGALACTYLPYSGIYIAGGILPKIISGEHPFPNVWFVWLFFYLLLLLLFACMLFVFAISF